MKKEISAGAVLYKIENNTILYLIEKMTLGHYSIPKGHLENNETLEEGAIREIYEETSLKVDLDISFKEKITYSPFEGIIKDVYFFVGKIISNNEPQDNHDNEVEFITFLPFKEALNILTHESDKGVLIKANEYITKKEIL